MMHYMINGLPIVVFHQLNVIKLPSLFHIIILFINNHFSFYGSYFGMNYSNVIGFFSLLILLD